MEHAVRLVVALDDVLGERRIPGNESRDGVAEHTERKVAHPAEEVPEGGHGRRGQFCAAFGDVQRVIAYALEVIVDFEGHEDGTEVVGGRLVEGENAKAPGVVGVLHLIDGLIALVELRENRRVARHEGLCRRSQKAADLVGHLHDGFHEVAHLVAFFSHEFTPPVGAAGGSSRVQWVRL